jgi:hypothetical protein
MQNSFIYTSKLQISTKNMPIEEYIEVDGKDLIGDK